MNKAFPASIVFLVMAEAGRVPIQSGCNWSRSGISGVGLLYKLLDFETLLIYNPCRFRVMDVDARIR